MKYSWRKIFCSINNTKFIYQNFCWSVCWYCFNFFDSSFNFFLFDVTFFTWLSKSVLFTKLAISLLLAKFACFNLAAKFYDVNLLNSGVVIYLSWLRSIIFFSVSVIVVLWSVFFDWIINTRYFIFNSIKSSFSS